MREYIRYYLTGIVFLVALFFAVGTNLLVYPIFDIPLGNLMVVFAFFAAAAMPLTFPKRPVIVTFISILSCLLALAWLPVGAKLSGNLWLNFVNSGSASYYFMLLTYVSLFASLLCFAWSWIKLILWKTSDD